MERLRWMPEDLGQQYLIVNIAGFELRRINGGQVEEQMAVVVGKPYHRTPVFSDRIRFLEFNPYWNVPPDIAIKEELPTLRSNAAGLAAQGFEAVRGDQVVDLRSVDWSSVGAGRFPYQLRQRPGTNNALGRVKFMFPNPHNLRDPLPVHITYLTAWVDNGAANFRQDIYGHDAKLLAALEGKSIAW